MQDEKNSYEYAKSQLDLGILKFESNDFAGASINFSKALEVDDDILGDLKYIGLLFCSLCSILKNQSTQY